MAERQERNAAELGENINSTVRPDSSNSLQSIIGNMALAHEMIINDDFRLEAFQDNT